MAKWAPLFFNACEMGGFLQPPGGHRDPVRRFDLRQGPVSLGRSSSWAPWRPLGEEKPWFSLMVFHPPKRFSSPPKNKIVHPQKTCFLMSLDYFLAAKARFWPTCHRCSSQRMLLWGIFKIFQDLFRSWEPSNAGLFQVVASEDLKAKLESSKSKAKLVPAGTCRGKAYFPSWAIFWRAKVSSNQKLAGFE